MRTEKAFKNVVVSLGSYLLLLLLAIFVRRLLLTNVDVELVAYDGLLSNIFALIATADLGAGGLFTYRMYEAFAQQNQRRIQELLNMYRTLFQMLGFFVLAICAVLYFLLPVIFAGKVQQWGYFRLMYLLYSASAVLSYFFVYWRILLASAQVEYQAVRIETAMQSISAISKLIVLTVVGSYFCYLLVTTVISILTPVFVAFRSKREFAWVQRQDISYADMKKEGFFPELRQLMVVKFANTVNNSTDGILITLLVQVRDVALYGNYILIGSNLCNLITKLIVPLRASIADKVYSEGKNASWELYRMIDLFCWFLSSVCFVGYITVFQRAIAVFFGAEFLLPSSFVMAYALNTYIGFRSQATVAFRECFGEYGVERIYSVLGMIVNLGCSVLLSLKFGITGIMLGTVAASLCLWHNRIVIVDKRFFGRSLLKTWGREGGFLLLAFAELFAASCITVLIPDTVWGMLLCCCVAVVVPSVINLLLFFRAKEFHQMVQHIRVLAEGIWRKVKREG